MKIERNKHYLKRTLLGPFQRALINLINRSFSAQLHGTGFASHDIEFNDFRNNLGTGHKVKGGGGGLGKSYIWCLHFW
jgi:hypothetical protein